MKAKHLTLSFLVLCVLTGCGNPDQDNTALDAAGEYRDDTAWAQHSYQGKPATQATIASQRVAERELPDGDFLDGSMMREHSSEIFITPLPPGTGALDVEAYAFVEGDRPEQIHPSIYAYMRETYKESGLFKLDEGIYQIRGDLAHITLVRGKTGWIVLDAGTTLEFAKGAWNFVHELLPGGLEVPISTVIYSHSHIDHFGGVKGLISESDVEAGRIEIIAPYGFMQEALAENVIAGSAMMRRAQYHFGANLETEPDGTGLFFISLLNGEFTLIAPTVELPAGRGAITERTVDGIRLQFKDISTAEAPAATLILGQSLIRDKSQDFHIAQTFMDESLIYMGQSAFSI